MEGKRRKALTRADARCHWKNLKKLLPQRRRKVTPP
jgi:hypothetical protein